MSARIDEQLDLIVAHLREIAENPDLGRDTQLGSLELDSLQLIEWFTAIEEVLDIRIAVESLDFDELLPMTVREVWEQLDCLKLGSGNQASI